MSVLFNAVPLVAYAEPNLVRHSEFPEESFNRRCPRVRASGWNHADVVSSIEMYGQLTQKPPGDEGVTCNHQASLTLFL